MLSLRPRDDFYIEVSRDHLTIQNLTTGERREHHPAVHVPRGKKRYEFAGGAEGGTNGFGHPRAFVGDFGAASGALHRALESVRRSKFIAPGRMLLHVQDEYEGGLSEPEVRAGVDLCFGAGARSARVYDRPGVLSRADVERLIGGKHGDVPGLF